MEVFERLGQKILSRALISLEQTLAEVKEYYVYTNTVSVCDLCWTGSELKIPGKNENKALSLVLSKIIVPDSFAEGTITIKVEHSTLLGDYNDVLVVKPGVNTVNLEVKLLPDVWFDDIDKITLRISIKPLSDGEDIDVSEWTFVGKLKEGFFV